MSSDALILDQSWHQAAMFFVLAGVAVVASLTRQSVDPALRAVIGTITCGVLLWLGVSALTWSARIDDAGVAVHAPAGIVQRSTFISWAEMAAVEIIPCGWNQQGLHIVSRQRAEIILPLGQIPKSELASVAGRITMQRAIRIAPDARTFHAQLDRIVPSKENLFRLRVRAARERLASASS
jgi:hypothetical protein